MFAAWQRAREMIRSINLFAIGECVRVQHKTARFFQQQKKKKEKRENKLRKHSCRTFAMGYCYFGVDWRQMLRLRMNNNFSFFVLLNRSHTLKYSPRHLRATITDILMEMACRAHFSSIKMQRNAGYICKSKRKNRNENKYIRRRERWIDRSSAQHLIASNLNEHAADGDANRVRFFDGPEDAGATILCRQTWIDMWQTRRRNTIANQSVFFFQTSKFGWFWSFWIKRIFFRVSILSSSADTYAVGHHVSSHHKSCDGAHTWKSQSKERKHSFVTFHNHKVQFERRTQRGRRLSIREIVAIRIDKKNS